jgi:hypothetical protein
LDWTISIVCIGISSSILLFLFFYFFLFDLPQTLYSFGVLFLFSHFLLNLFYSPLLIFAYVSLLVLHYFPFFLFFLSILSFDSFLLFFPSILSFFSFLLFFLVWSFLCSPFVASLYLFRLILRELQCFLPTSYTTFCALYTFHAIFLLTLLPLLWIT